MSPVASNKRRKRAIITAEIGWGCGLEAAQRGPELLLDAGLAQRLGATVVRIKAVPAMEDGPLEGDALEDAIMEHARRVSDAVVEAIQGGQFPIVIGGDHTSAIGFHTGLARVHGETGIIWADTHPDLNTPESSPSGNIHGMMLAGLLGKGSKKMIATTAACQTRKEHVAMVGIRSIDEGEQKLLDEGNIHCMTMDVVRKEGLEHCMHNAVSTANKAKSGFGLTIDIDVIDPSQAPFVATPVENGIDADELAEVLAHLPHKDRLLGLEVVEFTPRNDDDAAIACDLMASLIAAI
jgi:arginase